MQIIHPDLAKWLAVTQNVSDKSHPWAKRQAIFEPHDKETITLKLSGIAKDGKRYTTYNKIPIKTSGRGAPESFKLHPITAAIRDWITKAEVAE